MVKKTRAGIVDQQKQFEPGRPLHRIVKVGRAIIVGHDSAAVGIAVDDRPFLRAGPADRAELARHVARNRHRLAKHDLADVDSDVLVSIDAFGQARRGGGKAASRLRAVGIELNVREMQRQALRRLDRRDDGIGAGGKAEIVAMDMQRMRQAEIDHGALQGLDDVARGDAVPGNDVVERERRARSP